MRKLLSLAPILALLMISTTVKAQIYQNFASQTGVNHSYDTGEFGGGVSFADYNKDGWDDLTFATSNGTTIQVYKNLGNDSFAIDTAMTPPDTSQQKHVIWIDYDKDGDNDLFVSSYSAESRLYRNDGDTTLVDVTTSAGVATYVNDSDPVFGVCWGDYNNDGYADLYITKHSVDDKNYLFKNNQNGTFTDVSIAAGVRDSSKKLAFCAAFIDYNNDGYQDIYISYDRYSIENTLFKNNGDNTFTDVSVSSGANIAVNAMSVGVGDYDNNGYLDIYITNTNEGNKLIRNNGNGTFTEVADTTNCALESVSWAANFLDANNDRTWDLYVSSMVDNSNVLSSELYLNNNDSVFIETQNWLMVNDTAISFSNAIGDFNNDGFTDIAVSNYTPYQSALWKSSSNGRRWLKFELQGVDDTKEGLGTWIDVWAGGEKYSKYIICGDGFLTQNSFYPIIGLNVYNSADSVFVKWLDGTVDSFYNVTANKRYIVKQGITKQPAPKWPNKTVHYMCPGDSIVLDPGNFATYLWENDSTYNKRVIKTAGKYSLTVTNEYNFDATVELEVIMLDSIKVDISVKDLLCYDSADGEIKLDIIQGVYSTLDINWSVPFPNDTLITDINGGNYSVTISDTAQCFSISRAVPVHEPPVYYKQLVKFDNPCYGLVEGKAYLQTYGGTPPYTYDWGLYGNDDSLVDVSAGIYRYTITDSNGCILKDSVTINQPAPINTTMVSIPAKCKDSASGIARVIGFGGTTPYSYNWQGYTVDDDSLTGVPSGWYPVIVKDINNCTAEIDSVFVSEPDGISITETTIKHLDCYGDNSGEIAVDVAGGVGNFRYFWTPVEPNADSISGLPAGKYKLQVLDANDCEAIDSFELTEPDEIVLSTGSSPDTAGQGVGKAWVVVTSGGVGTINYSWSDNQDTDTATGLTSGDYTITVTDADGCESSTIVNVGLISSVNNLSAKFGSVNVYPNPASANVYIELNSLVSLDAEVVITNSLGQVMYSGDLNINTGDNSFTLDISKLPAGTYFININDGAERLAEIKLLVVK